jgi:hypothetical protein
MVVRVAILSVDVLVTILFVAGRMTTWYREMLATT